MPHLVELRRKLPQRVVACDLPALVEIDGAEHGLEGVLEVRRALPSAAYFLTMPQEQILAEPEPRRELRERRRADDARARLRELALGEIWEMRIKICAGGKLQHSISQKLKALVVYDASLRFVGV